jgi:hypothetical protein
VKELSYVKMLLKCLKTLILKIKIRSGEMKYKSNIQWESKVYINEYGDPVSTDEHDTKERAESICNMIKRDGFGGQGVDFPVKTWVSELPENDLEKDVLLFEEWFLSIPDADESLLERNGTDYNEAFIKTLFFDFCVKGKNK